LFNYLFFIFTVLRFLRGFDANYKRTSFMEQVINRIKNSIIDSVGYFDNYLSAKKRAGQFVINDKNIKYDADLAFDMMSRQHTMLKLFMELKHTVRAFNKSKTLRLLEKFCQQFTSNLESKNEIFFPLLQYVYANNAPTLEKVESLRRDFEHMLAAVKQFCDDCKTIDKIGPSNVDILMQHLDDAISSFVDYNNDEEHYLHSLYNRIPSYVAEGGKNPSSIDIMNAG